MFYKLKDLPVPIPLVLSMLLNLCLMFFNISSGNYLAAIAQVVVVISLIVLVFFIGKNKKIKTESVEYVKKLCSDSNRVIVSRGKQLKE